MNFTSALTITTDMSPLSTNDETCNSHCGGFNPIVGKSSNDVILTRMKSVDSAVCSMFTSSPTSHIGSNYGIYDSISSSNTNDDYSTINHLKSRFITDSDHCNDPGDNILLWQGHYNGDKDNNNWSYDDSGNFGTFLFGSQVNKRPITGGHNLVFNQYIRPPQNLPWLGYGASNNPPTCAVQAPGNIKSANPWNQALVNQKLGLAPSPVNAMMNLSVYPQRQQNTPSPGKKHSPSNNISAPKSTRNGLGNNKIPNFDHIVPSAAGDDASFANYMDKISQADAMKPNFDTQFYDVLRSLDTKTNNLSLDDNPLLFPVVSQREERFSRKVFVGGLPPDIDEEEITAAFKRFGALVVDWPHKAESKSYFPPKGYCFLLFQDEISVQNLIYACIMDESKYYWCVSSPTIKDKPVQIRPWSLTDSDFVMDGSEPLDPRKTIFVGGVPRPLRAVELAMIMDKLYGGVCYSGIDTDPELKYPKGAGRVAFSNQQSYIAAISARFVQLQHHDIDKRVEVKPYVLDDQMCDECQGSRCAGKFAPFFCANVACLQYYCEQCWAQIHSRQGREYHKPLVKEGADRPRTVPFRW